LRVSFFIIWIKWNRFFLKSLRNTKLNFNFIRKLSLSSNNIERIANLGSMKHLKILSLGRNSIKSIAGIVIMI
jgi:dynein light chain 1